VWSAVYKLLESQKVIFRKRDYADGVEKSHSGASDYQTEATCLNEFIEEIGVFVKNNISLNRRRIASRDTLKPFSN
jgi:hypothetical protein